jgi:hypothetical protein
MSGFNISQFRSSIGNYGITQNNKFLVFFGSPRSLLGTFGNIAASLLGSAVPGLSPFLRGVQSFSTLGIDNLVYLRAEKTRLPGTVFSTADINRYGIGPTQKMPVNVRFNDVPVTFIADAYGQIYNYFYSWTTQVQEFNPSNSSLVSGTASNLVGYKDDYVSDLYIVVYNNAGMPVNTFIMYDAYPIAVNDIPMAWDSQDSLMKITVTFSFKSFALDGVSSGLSTALASLGAITGDNQHRTQGLNGGDERLLYRTTNI